MARVRRRLLRHRPLSTSLALAELNAAVNDMFMIYVWVGVGSVAAVILICCVGACLLCRQVNKPDTITTVQTARYDALPTNPSAHKDPRSLASAPHNAVRENTDPSAPPLEEEAEQKSMFVAINMPSLGASMEQFMSAAARTCSKGRRYHV
jgi:hypothetical protein